MENGEGRKARPVHCRILASFPTTLRSFSFFFLSTCCTSLILLLPRNLEPSLGVSLPPSLSLSLLLSSLNPEERCVIRRVPPR